MNPFIDRLRALFAWQIENANLNLSDSELEAEIDARLEQFAEDLFGRMGGWGDIMEQRDKEILDRIEANNMPQKINFNDIIKDIK